MPHGVPNTIESIQARLVSADLGFMTSCLVWPELKSADGYGLVSYQSKMHLVHRLLYLSSVGLIPEKYEVDHLCHSRSESCGGSDACPHRACANVLHLEAVPPRVNWERSQCITVAYSKKTHCKNEHEFTEENTVWHMENGRPRRRCKTCLQARNPRIAVQSRARRAARRAARLAG